MHGTGTGTFNVYKSSSSISGCGHGCGGCGRGWRGVATVFAGSHWRVASRAAADPPSNVRVEDDGKGGREGKGTKGASRRPISLTS